MSNTLPVKTIILQGGSGSVLGTLAANTKTLTPTTQHFKILQGNVASAPNGQNTNVVLSGFDPAFTNGNNNQFVLSAGVWSVDLYSVFAMPNTGTAGVNHSVLLFGPSGVNISPSSIQSFGLNGWPSGYGTPLQLRCTVNVPVGTSAAMTPIFQQYLNATVTNVAFTITLAQIRAY
jgi:hypothetical protein